MSTITVRMRDQDAALVRKFAQFEGVTVSDFARAAILKRSKIPAISKNFAKRRHTTPENTSASTKCSLSSTNVTSVRHLPR